MGWLMGCVHLPKAPAPGHLDTARAQHMQRQLGAAAAAPQRRRQPLPRHAPRPRVGVQEGWAVGGGRAAAGAGGDGREGVVVDKALSAPSTLLRDQRGRFTDARPVRG